MRTVQLGQELRRRRRCEITAWAPMTGHPHECNAEFRMVLMRKHAIAASAGGKGHKVAPVAATRRLIVVAKALLRNRRSRAERVPVLGGRWPCRRRRTCTGQAGPAPARSWSLAMGWKPAWAPPCRGSAGPSTARAERNRHPLGIAHQGRPQAHPKLVRTAEGPARPEADLSADPAITGVGTGNFRWSLANGGRNQLKRACPPGKSGPIRIEQQ